MGRGAGDACPGRAGVTALGSDGTVGSEVVCSTSSAAGRGCWERRAFHCPSMLGKSNLLTAGSIFYSLKRVLHRTVFTNPAFICIVKIISFPALTT